MATATDLSHLTSAGRSITQVRRKFHLSLSGRSEHFCVDFDTRPMSVPVSVAEDDGRFTRRSSVPGRVVAVGADEGRSDIAGRCYGCQSLIVDRSS